MAVPAAGVAVDPTGLPLLVCVSLDRAVRERLATIIDGIGILVFVPDIETAHAVLGQQLEREAATASDGDGPDPGPIALGDLEIDPVRCRVRWGGQTLSLSRRERDLLVQLAGQPIRTWSYEQLYESAWPDAYLDPGPVHAAVKRLRRKLRDAGVAVEIESVRAIGYQLVPDGEWPPRRHAA